MKPLIAALLLCFGVSILASGMSAREAANRDLVTYWATGKQILRHQNPYGPSLLEIEQQAGFVKDNRPFYMRNPPTALPVALFAGLFPIKWAAIVWSLLLIASLIGSVHLIRDMYGRPPNRLPDWPPNRSPDRSPDRLHLFGYLFPPVLACLLSGQIGILLLLGIVLFLRWEQTKPFLAGSALVVCALKPQLFIPFAFVLVLKRHPALKGFAAALTLNLAVSYFLDPHGWPQYLQMMRSADIQNEFVPTISLFVRLLLHYKVFQFLPAFIACIWAWHKKPDWNLLLVVSVLVAPYAWFTDEAVLLPAVMAALYRTKSLTPFVCVMTVALLEVLAGVKINSGLYLWTAPAWLYLTTRAETTQLKEVELH